MDAVVSVEEPFMDSKFTFVAATIAIVITLFVGVRKYGDSSLKRKNLPPGNLGLPIIGEFWESISFFIALRHGKMIEWFQRRIVQYGPVFQTSFMGSKVVVLTGQAGNKFLLSGADNGIGITQGRSAEAIMGKNSIFGLSGSRHKLIRGAFMSFLNHDSIRRYVSQMDSLIEQQIFQELRWKDCVQVVKTMKKITFKITCSLLFALPDGEEKDAFYEDFTLALKGTLAVPFNLPGTTFGNAMQARGRISTLFSNIIARRKKLVGDGNLDCREDIISCLISLRDEDHGNPLSDEMIIDNLIALMIASHDTATVLLCQIMRKLSRDSAVYSNVLQEQIEVGKARQANGGKLCWKEMQNMKYTWNMTQELMRLTPPVAGTFRQAWRDTTFGGYDIPKGWQVLWMSAAGTHMDDKIFQDPEKFDPSRFENQRKSVPPYTYIPFGAGPRICPGAEFTRIEVLLVIHHLITTYRWTDMFQDEPIIYDPFPYPAKGHPIKLHPIQHKLI